MQGNVLRRGEEGCATTKTQLLAQRGSSAELPSSPLSLCRSELHGQYFASDVVFWTITIELGSHGLRSNASTGAMIDSILGIYRRSTWAHMRIGCTASLDFGVWDRTGCQRFMFLRKNVFKSFPSLWFLMHYASLMAMITSQTMPSVL